MTEYWRYREPYLPGFFVQAAEEMQLSRKHRLLDIACGTGAVAFGFAPFVGSITGIDLDEQALGVARSEALRNNIEIELVHRGIEDLPDDRATFDVATIGRALAYLPREATHARLDRLVSAQGKVFICGSMTADPLSGPWARAFREAGRRWGRRPMPALSGRDFMTGSVFSFEKAVVARKTRPVSVEDLLLRALGYSTLTPEAFGSSRDEYLEDVRAAITPHAVDGMVSETILTTGTIFRRANS